MLYFNLCIYAYKEENMEERTRRRRSMVFEDDIPEGIELQLEPEEETEEVVQTDVSEEEEAVDIESLVYINRYKLEHHCEETPGLILKYAGMCGQLKSQRDTLKGKLKYQEGEIELKLRRSPPKDVNTTEAAFKALLASNDTLQAIRDEILQTEREINAYEAILSALETRKKEEDNLVRLFVAGYYTATGGAGEVKSTFKAQPKVDTDSVANEMTNRLRAKRNKE